MKVLLISPVDPEIPGNLKFLMGGENSYTRTLLENPPPGVKYIHYLDALKKNQIEYSFWQKPLFLLIKARILPLSPQILCFHIREKFDLIHAHAHGVKLTGWKAPVVLSDSSSNLLFLKNYASWSNLYLRLSYTFKRFLIQRLGIYDQELNLQNAVLLVWSKFAREIHQALFDGGARMIVIPPGTPLPIKITIKKKKASFNILFIGIWFKRKGGYLLLESYKKLKEKYPFIRLTIIGEVPKKVDLPADTYHRDYLPQRKLLTQIFPKADVLVLVPEISEGYGLVVQEAASLGIPAIISSVCALPELVEGGKTGLIVKPGSVFELTKALETLINNPNLLTRIGKAAKKRFLKKFWLEVTNKKLLEVYHQVIRS